jgi:MFS family permease
LAAVLFFTGVWDYSEARAGLAFTPAPAIQVLVAPLAGRLIRRTGFRAMALAGAALLLAALVLLALFAGHDSAYLLVFLPSLLLGGSGIALLVTALSAAALVEMPPSRLATGTALSVTSRACGAVIGLSALAVILAGAPRDSLDAYHAVWWTMAGLCGAMTALVIRLPRRAVE